MLRHAMTSVTTPSSLLLWSPRSVSLSAFCTSKRCFQIHPRRLKEITTSIDTGTYLPSCKLTVGEWLNTWISEYTADWKPLTVSNYSKQIKKHLIPRLGAAKLEDLDTHTIQLFYNSLTKSGLAPKTVKNKHGFLHAALEQAISNGYIHKKPAAAANFPKSFGQKSSPWSQRKSPEC